MYFNTTNKHVPNTALFATFEHPKASHTYRQLAQQGVLVREFDSPPALRFGLPANEAEWRKLHSALDCLKL